jgi:hypothetical protein
MIARGYDDACDHNCADNECVTSVAAMAARSGARHLKLQKKAGGDPAVECDRQSGPAR